MNVTQRRLAATVRLWLLAAAAALTSAWADPSVPVFSAEYDVRINGLSVAEAQFSLSPTDKSNQYVYRQSSRSTGLAALFGRQSVKETSRWELTDQGIRPLEYRYQREGGEDDDRNVELRFDWAHHQVENRIEGQPWTMDIPDGTLDKLLVQVAMLIDLRAGQSEFTYPVADGGRLKHYRFAVIGEESLKLADGEYRTIKLQRTDDNRDTTYIWAAPDLNYIPVRFLKVKKSGIKYEMRLREFSRDTET